MTYTTIVSNSADRCSGGICVYNNGMVWLQNSILASNLNRGVISNCYTWPTSGGYITSTGHNLEDADTCGLDASGDLSNADPLLGPLTNDGNTWVHPLLLGSPAVDGGVCVVGITTDQRGVGRPQGMAGKCDIGAYEFAPVAPSVTVSGPAEGNVGESYAFTATVSPPTATLPISYTWVPTPASGQGTSVATYGWTTPGTKTVTVTVENFAASAFATHDILIAEHKIYLPLVLRVHQ